MPDIGCTKLLVPITIVAVLLHDNLLKTGVYSWNTYPAHLFVTHEHVPESTFTCIFASLSYWLH